MIFLISLAFALLISVLLAEPLRKHPFPFYFTALIISIAVVVCTWNHITFPEWFGTWIWPVFSRGALAGALFVIVMWAGAFQNGSALMKKFIPIRAQLSIMACILTFAHNIAYGKTYFTALFFNPSRLSATTLIAAICSLVMIIILIPLFITSFKPVRKKMKYENWKRLQRFAYLFYAILYCHIMLVTIPSAIKGRTGYKLTVFVYSFIFLSYLLCRIIKAVAVKEKTTDTLPKKQAGGIICGVVMAALILSTVASAEKAASAAEQLEILQAAIENNNPSTEETPSVSSEPETEDLSETAADTAEDSAENDTLTKSIYKDGTYTGSAKGNHGSSRDIEVSVTIENDHITAIEITGYRDDEEYFSPKIEGVGMIEEMLAKQSPYVDAITGATESSEGLIHAVSNALSVARSQ